MYPAQFEYVAPETLDENFGASQPPHRVGAELDPLPVGFDDVSSPGQSRLARARLGNARGDDGSLPAGAGEIEHHRIRQDLSRHELRMIALDGTDRLH